jgi:hypothetical protein
MLINQRAYRFVLVVILKTMHMPQLYLSLRLEDEDKWPHLGHIIANNFL